MSENSPRPMPPYVSSPSFAAIAEALGTDTQQTVEFIEAVRKISGRGKLKEILACIQTYKFRPPDLVAARLREPHRDNQRPRRRRKKRSGPTPKIPRPMYQPRPEPRYVWNPESRKFEPRGLPDPDDLHW